jgi:Uma2 family endonuclease
MPTVVSQPEQRVVLRSVSWETYERLLTENSDRSSPRLTYDRGILEIMSPSAEHEWYKELISDLVKLLARELRIEVLSLGSTTFRREATERGFEPDACFYFTHVRQLRGKPQIDLSVDPPPDIVVEVAVTRSSLSKFSIFAALGVPEVWSYEGSRLRIYRLDKPEYIEASSSSVLPGLGTQQLTDWLELAKDLDSVAWPDEVLQQFRRSRTP